jgi:signal transduction histidine kinase/response regulator RpfG family c-di-GMP phosphodiesterase
LIREIAIGAGAVLVTEEILTSPEAEGLIQALAGEPAWSELPVLVLSPAGTHSAATADMLERLHNVTLLERPVRTANLVSVLRTALRARRRQYELRDQLVELRQTEEQVRVLNDQLLSDLARMSRLHQVSTRLTRTGDMESLLYEILDAAMEINRADMGNVQLLEGDALRIVAQRGFKEPFLNFFQVVRHDTATACSEAMKTGERVLVEDIACSPLVAGSEEGKVMLEAGVRAVQCTPLLSRAGEMLGMLSLHYRAPQRSEPGDLRALDLLARQAADFIERVQGEEAIKEADRRKDQFLATLAHELRNPLAPIRNALQIMALAEDNAVLAAEARRMIDRQLGQLVRLIDDLLDVSRITRGKLELRKERVEISAVIRNAVDTALPLIESAGHTLEVKLPPGPVFLDADPIRLAQVFANLLNNAAKYMERGGRIWLTAEQDEDGIKVSVRDTGIGIPAEALTTVFDIFVQVDGSAGRHQGGLGIGLMLVKQLLELHGGSIEARSGGIGQGAEFIARLPMAVSQATAASAEHERHDLAAGCRILVADDNSDAAESMGLMLRMMGNEVRTVHDGAQALEEAAEFRPDLVLLDIGMPRMDGYEAARHIREQAWGRDMVLIALTGWGQDEDKRRAAEAGFDRHFTKPIQPADVVGLIAAYRKGDYLPRAGLG